MSAPTGVVIVGAGHLGKLLWDCLDGDDRWDVLGFIDDGLAGGRCFGKPIFASDRVTAPTRKAFMAIGFPDMRRTMLQRVAPLDLEWCTFVDRRSMVGREVVMGRGVLVLSFAMIASGVRLGDFTYLSSYSHVGTGAAVGSFTSILAGASIGKCRVGNDCVIGLKSACLDGADVGDNCTVAPFTLIRRRLPAGSFAAGLPARVRERASHADSEAASDDGAGRQADPAAGPSVSRSR